MNIQSAEKAESSCFERKTRVTKYVLLAKGVGYAVTLLLLMGIFMCLFVATREYPKCSDDFSYSYIYGSGNCRVLTIRDILVSQIKHYTAWGGRFWTHCVVQWLLMYDKLIFDLANVIVYGICTYYISRIGSSFSIIRWGIIAMVFWCLMPIPGSTIFWLTGSVNYLWAACMNVIFLYVFISNKINLLWAIPLSLISGNTHEGIALGVIGFIFGMLVFNRPLGSKRLILGAFYVAGALTNILAPGNFVRLDAISGDASNDALSDFVANLYIQIRRMMSLITNTNDIGVKFSFIAVCICFSLLVSRFISRRSQNVIILACLFLGAIFSIALNIVTGTIYPRALFGFCLFSFLAVIVAIFAVATPHVAKYILAGGLCVSVMLNMREMPRAWNSIVAMHESIEKIRREVGRGKELIAMPENLVNNDQRYMELWGIGRNMISNRPLVRYYGGDDFCVLQEDEMSVVVNNMELMKTMKPNCTVHLPDSYHAVKLMDKPRKVFVYLPPQKSPSKIKLVGEYLKKKQRSISPITLKYEGEYYVLWKSEELRARLLVKKENGEVVEMCL